MTLRFFVTCLTLACISALSLTATAATPPARLAIIIDDLGYGLSQARRVVQLPGPVACAVLPDTPRGYQIATLAHQHGKEVLLHLPMQSMDQLAAPDGALGIDTSRREFARMLKRFINATPHLSGVNNHKGSLLTRHPGHMQWLMEMLSEHSGLYFVDSYTTHQSVALNIAHENGVPALRRDVFLDPDPSPETVRREFERALTLARRNGYAVAIGHPYPATLELLEEKLPGLRAQGIELVAVSSLLGAAAPTPVELAAAGATENQVVASE